MYVNGQSVRAFVAALRCGDSEEARRIKEAAWALHREDREDLAGLHTVRAICDIESAIPVGSPQPLEVQPPCPK